MPKKEKKNPKTKRKVSIKSVNVVNPELKKKRLTFWITISIIGLF